MSDFLIYELTISPIRCTGCAKKITNALQLEGIKSVKVNVLAEKVIVIFDPALIALDNIEEALSLNNFKIVGMPVEVHLDSKKTRKAQFYFDSQLYGKDRNAIDQIIYRAVSYIKAGLKNYLILETDDMSHFQGNGYLLQVTYVPDIVRAGFIYDMLERSCAEFSISQGIISDSPKIHVYDQLLEQIKEKKSAESAVSQSKLIFAVAITLIFLSLTMILPMIDYFMPWIIYPNQFGVFSVYTITIFVLTLISLYFFGLASFKNAIVNYRSYRLLNMDSLITLGSLSSFILSILLFIVYFMEHVQNGVSRDLLMMQIMNVVQMLESTSLILTVITIGKYFEGEAKKTILNMQKQIFPSESLLRTTHYKYLEIKNKKFQIDSEKEYEVSLLEKDDHIQLVGGMRLLCDGIVIKGEVRAIDSICYGQDDPFIAKEGSRLKSGADILEGECILQIENTIENSMLFQVVNQLGLAQSQSEEKQEGISALFQNLSDHFVKGVIFCALIVLGIWCALIGFDQVIISQYCVWCFPFERAISLLVASCPCALGLAVPSVVVITLNMALKQGILIKKNTIFEQISKVKHIMFDKTGTLFTKIDNIAAFRQIKPIPKQFEQSGFIDRGTSSLTNDQKLDDLQLLQVLDDLSPDDVWALIALIEKDFKHPLADLLYSQSIKRSVARKASFQLASKPYFYKNGVIGEVVRVDRITPNLKVFIGNLKMMMEQKVDMEIEKVQDIILQESKGYTVLLVSIGQKLIMIIQLDNKSNLRPESRQVVSYLQRRLRKQIYILSGDSMKTVSHVGKYLKIPKEHLLGEMSADGKKGLIQDIKKDKGDEVMMIGDGLNDVLSLREAGVGVSINAKSELNLMASDVIVLNDNLWKIPILFNLMNLANRMVQINLVWAFAYNIGMAPISAGAFYSFGITISPMISSAAMSISSIVVVLISNIMRFINVEPSVGTKTFPEEQIEISILSTPHDSVKEKLLAV